MKKTTTKVNPKKPNLKIDVNLPVVPNPNYYFEPIKNPVDIQWEGMRRDGRRHSPRHIKEVEDRFKNT